MKISKNLWISFILLIVVATLYRVMPGRPYGFAPQIAMAIFGGAVISNKKWAFVLPVLSMFVSDGIFQLLYTNGIGNTPGFYDGQMTNYVLFGGMVVFGFFIKNFNMKKIAIAAVSAPTAYFLLSNFVVWLNPMAGLGRPLTFSGLMMTYSDGLPFYPWSIVSTAAFSALFFSAWYLMKKRVAHA